LSKAWAVLLTGAVNALGVSVEAAAAIFRGDL
jgi:hypothetical protein